ncbi:hypothetical protein KIN_09210 [Litoreibacter roseus]|uniref:Uncharacterized protein n=1 Tax=Litoreibacter roseus TaxID=2601869 RepID=A0A6N6JCZ5_9RHOB|nr:hypothetical protein KIN_09210 [Litoreibacter roseus]
MKRKVVKLVLLETELSPRELAVTFMDQECHFVSESTVYRTLKAHDLIASPAYSMMKAGLMNGAAPNATLWFVASEKPLQRQLRRSLRHR